MKNCKFFIDFLQNFWKLLRRPGAQPPGTPHAAIPLQALPWWTSLPPNTVISEGSIFSNKFSKWKFKNSIFLYNFIKNFQNFRTICVFRPNARKINAWFVNFFEKYVKKIMDFPKFCKETFWKFSIICVFRPNAPKINAGFVKFFEKYAKVMHFLQFS